MPHRRKFPEDPRECHVILDGVKPNPGQNVVPRFGILVIRLVHVPEKAEIKLHPALSLPLPLSQTRKLDLDEFLKRSVGILGEDPAEYLRRRLLAPQGGKGSC